MVEARERILKLEKTEYALCMRVVEWLEEWIDK
jgi:hypothetical protein